MALIKANKIVTSEISDVIAKMVFANNGYVKCKVSEIIRYSIINRIYITEDASIIGRNMEEISDILKEKYNIDSYVILKGNAGRIYKFKLQELIDSNPIRLSKML